MVETLGTLPEELGEVSELLTDAGYFSEANVVNPLIATGRESHHLPWQERFGEPLPLFEPADAVERMKRKQTVEPVFGIIKAGMRFRQFLLRGLEAVRGGGRW